MKDLRLSSQAASFILCLAVFFGLASWPRVAAFESATQFLPALSGAVWLDLPRFWPVVLLLAVLPLVFGRLYCSWWCPAGFLQDAAGRLAAGLGLSPKPAGGRSVVRYASFGLAWALLLSGSAAFRLLDHSSLLGGFLGLADLAWSERALDGLAAWSLFFGLVLLALPLWKPRWFCATLCPTGCLFMLMRGKALFKTRVGPGCAGCGACSRSCPVRCVEKGRLDDSRCVDCLECLASCPTGRLAYRFEAPWSSAPAAADPGRRRFLLAAGAVALGGLTARRLHAGALGHPAGEPREGVPPGGRAVDEFYSRCVGCGACASVCPTRIIERKGFEPLAGMGQARMAFGTKACSYECNACLAVCPSGALAYFPLPVKKRIKIGSSILKKERCLPIAHDKDCAACHERCPTGAISMVPHKKTRKPELKDDYCIGCGACEAACPVLPEKAIAVRPKRLHTFAFIPRKAGRGARLSDIKPDRDEGFAF
ncbi:MAG: 4Fe-4S dicluster domain-containing protein [Elusimicrobia bacterium]|nr:4Fe-4S dicluster domain-containing protein [Elusimicrobiota bacterium]